jgi:hypothetical protein
MPRERQLQRLWTKRDMRGLFALFLPGFLKSYYARLSNGGASDTELGSLPKFDRASPKKKSRELKL